MPPRTDDPRPHHYQFAHSALPSIVHRVGTAMVHNAANRDLAGALQGLWAEVASRLPAEQRLDPTGLAGTYVPDPDMPMVVVTMPQARHMVEAHFAAIAAVGGQVRYLVLEESWSPVHAEATVIGEWTVEGHFNLGPGPAPDREGFVHAVYEKLRPATRADSHR